LIIKKVNNWKTVSVLKTTGSAYNVLLDNDHLLTELGNIIELPRKLAVSVAKEWRRNQDVEKIKKEFHTKFCFSVFDHTAPLRLKVSQTILEYADCDLVCYLAENPIELVERQKKLFAMYIDWADEFFTIKLRTGTGIKHVKQNRKNEAKIKRYLEKLNNFELTIVYELTNLTGSFFIATAVFIGFVKAKDAWNASVIEDTYRIERWGEVEEEVAVSKNKKEYFFSFVKLMDKLG